MGFSFGASIHSFHKLKQLMWIWSFGINPKIFKSRSILRPSLSTSWRIELKLVPRQSIYEPIIEHNIQTLHRALHPFGSRVAHMIATSCHV